MIERLRELPRAHVSSVRLTADVIDAQFLAEVEAALDGLDYQWVRGQWVRGQWVAGESG